MIARFGRRRHDIVMLVGAQVLGQLVLLGVIPVLTRVFAPAEFGLYQVALSVALVLQPIATLRVEFVLPVAKAPDRARELVRRARLSSVVVTGMLGVVAAATLLTGREDAGMIAGMTAVLTAVHAWIAVDNALLIRAGQVRRLALRNLVGGALSGVFQLLVALSFRHIAGLAVAILLGRAVAILVSRSPGATGHALGDAVDDLGYGGARAFRTVVVGLMSGTVLQSLTLIAGATFGGAAAGYVGTAQRVTGTPATLVGQGIAQAVQGTFSAAITQTGGRLLPAVRRVVGVLAVFGGSVGLAIGLLGPVLVVPVLGAEWEPVGPVVALLALPVALQIIMGPVTPVLVMIGQEKTLLVLQSSRLAGSVAVALLVAGTGDFLVLVGAFAAATVVAYLATLAVIFMRARAFDRQRLERMAVVP